MATPPTPTTPAAASSIPHTTASIGEAELAALRKFIWPSDLTSGDTARWHAQGFEFGDYETTRFGLLQKSGACLLCDGCVCVSE